MRDSFEESLDSCFDGSRAADDAQRRVGHAKKRTTKATVDEGRVDQKRFVNAWKDARLKWHWLLVPALLHSLRHSIF